MIKTLDKTFVLEITSSDINTITDALHELYTVKRKEYNEHGGEKLYNEWVSFRELRNEFASLIGRNFMGKDA